MDWKELLGFITGAACVWLCVTASIWNWPTGIANNIFYIVVFWQSGLYGDSLLQWVYLAIAVYGWWHWPHGGADHSRLNVTRTSAGAFARYLIATAMGTLILFELLRRFTNSTVPFWDGLTTALSLTAQYMLTRKVIENWWFWITADVIYIALYVYKRLYLTSVLYAIFLGMCIVGLRQWRQMIARRDSAVAQEATA